MEKLNLPPYAFRQKTENNQLLIFDEIRRKYVALTPEEWVRQSMTKFLICERKFPPEKIAIETAISFKRDAMHMPRFGTNESGCRGWG